MKEIILDILLICEAESTMTHASEEIATLMSEFIQWFHTYYGKQIPLQINDEPRMYITQVRSIYEPLDKIFKHWFETVESTCDDTGFRMAIKNRNEKGK